MSSLDRGRVLYITYDGLLEPLGASQVLPYVLGLAGAGVEMDLLSFEKPSDLEDGGGMAALKARLGEAGVGWTAKTYHKRPSLPATAWDVAHGRGFVRRWVRSALRDRVPALVHARSYVAGLMGMPGSGPRTHRFLFDMRGFWVDERIDGGYWAPGSLPVRVGRWAERSLLASADHLILLTHRATGRLPELSGGAPVPPHTVVPTCVDLERFSPPPGDGAEARAELGVGPGPVLIHVGTLTGWYEGAATMAVARAFLQATGGTFVVLTRDVEEARRMASEAGVEALITQASPSQVPRWLQAADAGLALVKTAPSKEASFPTKVGEYLAAGLAVLGTPVGDMERLESPDLVRLMRPGDAPEMLARWLADAARRPGRKAEARALAERDLGLDAGLEALLGVYARLGVGGSR